MRQRQFVECPYCRGVARLVGTKYVCTECGISFYKIDDNIKDDDNYER